MRILERLKIIYQKPVELACGALMVSITAVVFLQVVSGMYSATLSTGRKKWPGISLSGWLFSERLWLCGAARTSASMLW